jgi:diguanylate cyclase (GGDEF)-like protein
VTLDIATLFAVTVFTTGVGGALLLFAWVQSRGTTSLAWWGAAFLLFAPASALFGSRGLVADIWSIELANALMLLAYGLLWTGGRVFEGRKPLPLWAVAGAIAWLVACRFDAFIHSVPARIACVSVIIGCYCAAFVRELWLGRRDGLVSRWPVMGLVALHAILFPIRAPAILSLPFPLGAAPARSDVFALLIFIPLLYAFALVFLLMALTKERAESKQRRAATIDPLTGIPNRRGFCERAERLIVRSKRDGVPLTLLVFDLDNFKNINDRFGHHTGDAVLSLFSACAAQTLRPLDLVGRLGGEEFVALLPAVSGDTALEIAERVRKRFVLAAREVDGRPVAGTVSAGTATASEGGYDFDALYAAADAALYRAKQKGRNRTEAGRPPADAERNRSVPANVTG